MMLHARDEDDGSQMTDEQLADEVRTFLLAGHETTAITLSWTLVSAGQPSAEFRRHSQRSWTPCWPVACRRWPICRA